MRLLKGNERVSYSLRRMVLFSIKVEKPLFVLFQLRTLEKIPSKTNSRLLVEKYNYFFVAICVKLNN